MELDVLRDDMVASLEHESKGFVESAALSVAMRSVPREEFVDETEQAYLDKAFDHRGTRVLAPSMAARLLETLAPERGDSVLVVGAGVGYTAAVLAEMVGAERVHAVDITRALVHDARQNLARAGYPEVFVDRRDGADGLPEYAPFDRILLEAAAVEPPAALANQLAPDGRLVMPLGASEQTLVAVEGTEVVERAGPVAFTPLLVEGEQSGAVERNRTMREDREHAARALDARKGWEQDWIDWDGHI